MEQNQQTATKTKKIKLDFKDSKYATGRRKRSIAKVWVKKGSGNIYVNGIDAWEERNWIGKIIKINNISFKVEKNIPRCVAINLKPNTDDNSLDLLKSLKILEKILGIR